MKKTGDMLKKARESKGYTLHEVGLSLKINSKILKAIEDGDKAALPAKTFLRGFVQSYAAYLKLDTAEVLKVFHDEVGTTKPSYIGKASPDEIPRKDGTRAENRAAETRKETRTTSSDDSSLDQSGPSRARVAVTIVTVVILGALFVTTKKVVDRYQKEGDVSGNVDVKKGAPGKADDSTHIVATTPPVPTSTATDASAVNAPGSDKTLSDTVVDNSLTEPLPPPQALTPTPTTPAVPETPANKTSSTHKTDKTDKPDKEVKKETAEVKPKPSSEPASTTEAPKPETEPAKETAAAAATNKKGESGKNIELIVEALDDVELEIQSANGKSEIVKLSADQFHTIKNKSGLKLNVSNGGAVNVYLNGKDLGVPGVLGKPKTLTF